MFATLYFNVGDNLINSCEFVPGYFLIKIPNAVRIVVYISKI